ncbi:MULTISPECIES: F0F1 ATP synthase subunit B family protein [unclassified Sphingomonas]|uniref:F0F1 ATP synthase subunit B family protein n=1 Tax=unclassified Sphingomonas TaxID=196159 RepID=UPI0006F9C5C8|nr:ATP synthase subunit B [Sphingomonas sp. Leaf198]
MAPEGAIDNQGLQGHTTAPGGVEHVPDPTALGLTSTGWVAVAMIVVILLMIWKKVPGMIGKMLDTRIAGIRTQLDEAKALRAEAEAIRSEYEAKAKTAHVEAEAMKAHAHHEAAAIIAKAKAGAEDLMTRRAKMAEDKIAAAERAAIAEVRARAADAAAKAAGILIAEHHDAAADRMMVDRSISGLSRLN